MKRTLSLAAILMNAIILVTTVANAGQLFLGMSLAVEHSEQLTLGPVPVTAPPAPFDDQLRVTRQLSLADFDQVGTTNSSPAALLENQAEAASFDLHRYSRRATFLFGSIDLARTNANLAGDNAGLVGGLLEAGPDAHGKTDLHLSFNASYELVERSTMKEFTDFHVGVSYHF